MTSNALFPDDARLLPLHLSDAERDAPPPALDALLRRCYPTEREIEAMLARKLAHRAQPAARPPTLQQLCEQVRAFLATVIDGPFEVGQPRWFAGGASKIQMGFTLRRTLDEGRMQDTPLVVRMEPAESLNATSRAREFQLLKAFEGRLPVPRTYWVDAEGRHFAEPALIYAYASGVTKPSRTRSGALSGIGTQFPAELRSKLAPQFVQHLATIHRHDGSGPGFEAFDRPRTGSTQSAEWQLNRARRVWEEDREGDLPLLELAANWLQRTLPTLDAVSIVHGDYRSGNFLFDEATAEITAVLDWERGYLGDRHRDLAWAASPVFGGLAEDGKTFLASGLLPPEQLFDDYQRLSGLSVDPQRLRWYAVFNAYQVAVAALATSRRVVRLAKSHQDILLASTEAVGWGAVELLRRTLEDLT
jgi:aminoglycoside phosphotransferase (APT) family kinase protein